MRTLCKPYVVVFIVTPLSVSDARSGLSSRSSLRYRAGAMAAGIAPRNKTGLRSDIYS